MFFLNVLECLIELQVILQINNGQRISKTKGSYQYMERFSIKDYKTHTLKKQAKWQEQNLHHMLTNLHKISPSSNSSLPGIQYLHEDKPSFQKSCRLMTLQKAKKWIGSPLNLEFSLILKVRNSNIVVDLPKVGCVVHIYRNNSSNTLHYLVLMKSTHIIRILAYNILGNFWVLGLNLKALYIVKTVHQFYLQMHISIIWIRRKMNSNDTFFLPVSREAESKVTDKSPEAVVKEGKSPC